MRAPPNSPEIVARMVYKMEGEALDGRMAPMLPLCSVLNEPAPGFLRHVWLGEEGVQMFVADLHILIPTQELWAVADAAVASVPDKFIVADRQVSSPTVQSAEAILPGKILHIISARSSAIPHLPVHEAFAIGEPGALHRTIFGRHGVAVEVGETQIYFGLAELLKLAEAAVPAFRPSPGRGLTKIEA